MTPRPPDLAARLLRTEANALLPILRRTPAQAFDRPTVCTGWSVRDVLAHCAAALVRLAESRLHQFTPEQNEADVAERRPWPLEDVLAELERGYAVAGPTLTAAPARGDGIALGEWVHGGDVREACRSRCRMRATASRTPWSCWSSAAEPGPCRPPTSACPTGSCCWAWPPTSAAPRAELVTDAATLVRLCSGRHPDPSRFALRGADPDRYQLFG